MIGYSARLSRITMSWVQRDLTSEKVANGARRRS